MTTEVVDERTPDELAEQGVGLIAQAMFRANKQSGPAEASQIGETCVDVVRGMWLDFYRMAVNAKSEGR